MGLPQYTVDYVVKDAFIVNKFNPDVLNKPYPGMKFPSMSNKKTRRTEIVNSSEDATYIFKRDY